MFGMNFFDMGGAGAPRPFKNQYRCYSVSMMPDDRNESLEHGGMCAILLEVYFVVHYNYMYIVTHENSNLMDILNVFIGVLGLQLKERYA